MKSALFMLLALALETVFYYYQIKALPEDTRNIPIILTDFEIKGFKDKKWLETREKMVGYILKTYPHVYSPLEQVTIN